MISDASIIVQRTLQQFRQPHIVIDVLYLGSGHQLQGWGSGVGGYRTVGEWGGGGGTKGFEVVLTWELEVEAILKRGAKEFHSLKKKRGGGALKV